MQRAVGILLSTLMALAFVAPAFARGHHSYYRAYHSRIHRSERAKRAFERMTGYPHGRPGYIVDHVVPLACGGPDAPSNMQWQTKADAKAKDKWERKGCSHSRRR